MLRPALFLACLVGLATPALAQTVCNDSFANTIIRGNLVVPSGASCTLTSVLVTGNVHLQPGSVAFTATSTYISGNLNSHGAAVSLTNGSDDLFYAPSITTIGGHLQAAGGSLYAKGIFVATDIQTNDMDWVVLAGVSTGGDMTILNTTGVVPGFPNNFVCGATVGNNLQLQANGAGAVFLLGDSGANSCPGNTVVGNADIINNRAAVTVSGNIFMGNLQCQTNAISVRPTGSGNAIAGNKSGCKGL